MQDTVGGDWEMVRGWIRRAGKAIRSWHGTAGSPLDAKARETPGVARYNFLSFQSEDGININRISLGQHTPATDSQPVGTDAFLC